MTARSSVSTEVVQTETLIVGAGPAGLAVAACLRVKDADFTLLEASNVIAFSWRNRYDRLHLHTNKAASELPHFSMPRTYPRYPSRDQVVTYLEGYTQRFRLEPLFGQKIVGLRRENNEWVSRTEDTAYRSEHVVVATGETRVPHRPKLAGRDAFQGQILHSSEFRSGAKFAGKKVLVIGAGNSGAEIALDLHEQGARPSLSVRGPVNILPRDLLGIPIVVLGRWLGYLPATLADAFTAPVLRPMFMSLRRRGLRAHRFGAFVQMKRRGQIPLIDVGTVALIRSGQLPIHPAVSALTARGAQFEDGTAADFDAVIQATGFRPALEEFLGPIEALNKQGSPQWSVGSRDCPNLHFCGYRINPGGILRDIGIEAAAIAKHITRGATVSRS